MKRILLITFLMISSFATGQSQEWMTSLEVAKSLAYVQNKFLFVVWEDASYDPYPVLIRDQGGVAVVDDLFTNESINEVVWEHFVPVILSELKYEELYYEINGKRSQSYIDKFNDDSIKIMDINGNIVNSNIEGYGYLDIAKFITVYALNTEFLKTELSNYRSQRDFNTSYRLAAKYLDYATLLNDFVKPEIIKLSNLYLKEAETYLQESGAGELRQKLELQSIKQSLVMGKPKKVLRQLKRLNNAEIKSSNEQLVALLYFTSYILLKDEKKASQWRSKLSLVNLKKANLIIKNNS